eukprot:4554818-Lingulodinium_polyedra.AAC.1
MRKNSGLARWSCLPSPWGAQLAPRNTKGCARVRGKPIRSDEMTWTTSPTALEQPDTVRDR